MGLFQLELFYGSLIFVGDSCKISEHKLSEYFSMNKSSDQNLCTNTSKPQHRETQTSRNKGVTGYLLSLIFAFHEQEQQKKAKTKPPKQQHKRGRK